jgi:hypothetical protein
MLKGMEVNIITNKQDHYYCISFFKMIIHLILDIMLYIELTEYASRNQYTSNVFTGCIISQQTTFFLLVI